MTTRYLACDLGADSGRLILGTLQDNQLAMEEIHRFPNVPIKSSGSIHWDIDALWRQFQEGLAKVPSTARPIHGISCDSWGVDYLLFDAQGQIIPPTYHYRDSRCQRGVEIMRQRVAWPVIFEETGIQFMPLNTLYQLAAEDSQRLAQARQLLCIGDGFNYLMSGVARTELSLASTTQLYNPRAQAWSRPLLEAVSVTPDLFPPLVASGTLLGPLRPELARLAGLDQTQVVASCSHDTGAAVAAVPAQGGNWAYLSSGTWSLIGVESAQPIIHAECRELNFTNELGYGGSVRLLKNIIGLWLVQECRRSWKQKGREFSFAELEQLARQAPAFVSLINPSDARFLAPDNMPEKIASLCRETGQPVPDSPGATVRCIYESLALLYRFTLRRLEGLLGKKLERLHIVGGGSKDNLLNQFAASATGLPVLAGPVEATALGNILVQALALGHLASLDQARTVVRNSVSLSQVTPQETTTWDSAAEKFASLVK